MNEVSHDSEIAAHGQQVITACALIHQKFNGVEKVFLPKRAATKKFLPGVFEIPGGHIDFGEDIVDGLKREIDEELNVSIEVGDPFYVFTYTNDTKGSHSIEVVYFAKFIESSDNIQLDASDHSEYGWFAESEIERAYTVDKGADDEEFKAIKRGFELLRGESLAMVA
jgi:8-oxo-dGTP diphosphatase